MGDIVMAMLWGVVVALPLLVLALLANVVLGLLGW